MANTQVLTQAESEAFVTRAAKELDASLLIVKLLAPYSTENRARLLNAAILLLEITDD